MKGINFVVHGTPYGHKVWGSDDQYYNLFYSHNSDFGTVNSVLSVSIRNTVNFKKSYYTYLLPANVIDCNGRQGSYFGMTLEFADKYCKDVASLNHLLEMVYSNKIIDHILSRTGKNHRFLVEDFVDADEYLKEIEDIVERQIEAKMSEDFEDIDSSFTMSSSDKSVFYSLDDVGDNAFFEATKTYGSVYISAEYPSKDERLQSVDKKLADMSKDYEARLAKVINENSALQAQIDSEKQKANRQKESFMEFQSENEKLKKDKERLNNRVLQLKNMVDLDKLSARFDPSLSELIEILKDYNKTHKQGPVQPAWLIKFLKALSILLASLVIFLGGYVLTIYFRHKPIEQQENFRHQADSLKDVVLNLQDQIDSLKLEYDAKCAEFSELNARNEGVTAQHVEKQSVDVPKTLPGNIDIESYSGKGPLKGGLQYTIMIKGCNVSGQWNVTGGKIMGSDTDSSVKVIPSTDANELTITFTADGYKPVKRTISVTNESI